jgi:hypothetical protein
MNEQFYWILLIVFSFAMLFALILLFILFIALVLL